MRNIKVWAHRGASGYAPENTVEAFELAARQGADGVELDVQICKSGEIVVIHDESIDRVTRGKGLVKDHTLEELKEYSNGKIPCLQDVYHILKPTGLMINVELKTGIVMYPDIEKRVLDVTKDMEMEERVWYSSFHHQTLCRIRELSPKSKTGLLYADGWIGLQQYASRLGVEALHPAYYHLQEPGYMDLCRKYNLAVHVWTVNKEEDIRKLCESGVDAIITNYPDIAGKIADRF